MSLVYHIEPAIVEGNRQLSSALGASDSCDVICCPAEEYISETSLDLVFTSPPYFDLELYGKASTAAGHRYGSVDGWVSGFLRPVMVRAFQHLRSGRHLVLNLPCRPIRGVRLDLAAMGEAQALGFEFQRTEWLPVRTFKGTIKGEPLLVWRKPS